MSKFGHLIPKAVPSMTHHHHADKIDWDRIFTFHSLSFLILGVLCACVALNGFMVPNNFLDGGVTGVCILLSKKLGLNLNVLIALLNAPFIWIGYKKIGKTFAVQTTLAIVLLTIGIEFVKVPIITDDKVLIALFGGFFIGLGIGLAIRSGCVLDGLEVVADYTNRKSGFSTSELVMMFNTMVILSAAIFFDWEVGMYSIITYFTAMKISDYVVDGFEEYTALTVISGKHEMVKNIIVNDFNIAISDFKL